MKPGDTLVVEACELDAILDNLRRGGHTLVAPTLRDGAGPTSRTRVATRSASARTAPSSATRSGRTPGSATFTRRGW
jgi:hypothetical protein